MSANATVVLALSLLATTPSKQLPRSRTDLREAQVTTATLDNGLEVVVFEAHASPLVSVWTWYRSGSRDERPGATGITHLLEHMTFEGTEDLSADKMAGSVEGVAGEWNGYTFLDSTAYFETVPKEALGGVLHLEAQRMGHASLPQERLEAVRTAVTGELSGSDASPADQLDRAVAGAAFQAHPYHWATVGYASDLAAVTRDSLLDWYHAHYLPSNATLVIVGDVKASEAIDAARKELGALPKATPPPPVTTVEPPQEGERRIVLARGSGPRLLEIAWRAPAAGDPDFPAYLVADAILGGAKGTNLWTLPDAPASKSSRLGAALLATKLATTRGATCFPPAIPTWKRSGSPSRPTPIPARSRRRPSPRRNSSPPRSPRRTWPGRAASSPPGWSSRRRGTPRPPTSWVSSPSPPRMPAPGGRSSAFRTR